MNLSKQLVIIGGGPAGLAAAISAKENGIDDILVLERDSKLGGILNQCIHSGFGLHIFGEELTGPEYAERYEKKTADLGIECLTNTMVLDINNNKMVTAVSKEKGFLEIQAQAIILAAGCRERTRGAINIPGTRPSGIFTAGTAQYFINIVGEPVGKKAVILGSGDIGLIMARRLTLEGAKVNMVLELMPYSNGLGRNIAQCLEDYDIPLLLSHTIVGISGKERLEGITIAKVDDKLLSISGTEQYIECDTLLLSVGLIPENELALDAGVELSPITGGAIVDERLQTNIPGIFACGNVLHVHDLVDYVSDEASRAGKNAAEFLNHNNDNKDITTKIISSQNGVRYCVPQKFSNLTPETPLFFRVATPSTGKKIIIIADGEVIFRKREAFLVPSEMQMLKLPDDVCKKINNAKIVSLELE